MLIVMVDEIDRRLKQSSKDLSLTSCLVPSAGKRLIVEPLSADSCRSTISRRGGFRSRTTFARSQRTRAAGSGSERRLDVSYERSRIQNRT